MVTVVQAFSRECQKVRSKQVSHCNQSIDTNINTTTSRLNKIEQKKERPAPPTLMYVELAELVACCGLDAVTTAGAAVEPGAAGAGVATEPGARVMFVVLLL